jgi:hypothetical protein
VSGVWAARADCRIAGNRTENGGMLVVDDSLACGVLGARRHGEIFGDGTGKIRWLRHQPNRVDLEPNQGKRIRGMNNHVVIDSHCHTAPPACSHDPVSLMRRLSGAPFAQSKRRYLKRC